MIRVDTDGLLDRCQCGAVAGFVTGSTGKTCAMCADRCGQSTCMSETKEEAVTEWNIMQRQEKQNRKDKMMPSQLFRVTRAPEAPPITPQQIRRMISGERHDSEWDVQEMELPPARIVSAGHACELHRIMDGTCHVCGKSIRDNAQPHAEARSADSVQADVGKSHGGRND